MIDRQALLDSVPKGLYINGRWRDSSDGTTLDVDNPATGEVLATIASATPADGMAALDAAVAAQASWAKVAPRERGEILRTAYEIRLSLVGSEMCIRDRRGAGHDRECHAR